jgi:hypothetical protein
MTALWHHDGGAWKLLQGVAFDAEKVLHDLVAEAPELLPLSGSPRLTVLGRDLGLGGGYADLVAVEPSGQLALLR